MTAEQFDYDVIVIGGGAAGLSGAITLARQRRRVLVLDSGEPRNAPAAGVHGFLGHDGISPLELLERGRAELASYGGEFVARAVESARPIDRGFHVDGMTARRLLVTTGLVDELPDVPGLRDRWGHDVVHCPYCHGWEVRGQPIAVLASNPMAAHQAMLFSQLSDDVTLLLNGQLPPDELTAAKLARRGVAVVAGRVERIELTGDRISGVRLVDGTIVPCTTVTVASRVLARSSVLDELGLKAEPFLVGDLDLGTYVPADPTGRTAVPGGFVAGNVTNPMLQVVHAAGAGVAAAAALNMDLIEEDAAR